jgi:hypothetical protein
MKKRLAFASYLLLSVFCCIGSLRCFIWPLFFGRHEGAVSPDDSPYPFDDYAATLRDISRTEKWETTRRFIQLNHSIDPHRTGAGEIEGAVKKDLLACGRLTELWLSDFPEIFGHLKFTDQDIGGLNRMLAINSRQHWDEVVMDPSTQQPIRVYKTTRRTQSELARMLLAILSAEKIGQQ